MPSASHLLLSLSKTGEWLFSFFFVQQSSFKNLRRFVCQSEHSSMKKKDNTCGEKVKVIVQSF